MDVEKNFRVVQNAIIRQGKKFLIVKRAADEEVYPNYWDFPGGRLEQGELPAGGFKREVKEETGLDVEIGSVDFVFSERVSDHFVYFVLFDAKLKGVPKIKLSKEHSEFRWAKKEEILKLKVENYVRAYLEKEAK